MAERSGLVPVGLYLAAAAVLSVIGLFAARIDPSASEVLGVPEL